MAKYELGGWVTNPLYFSFSLSLKGVPRLSCSRPYLTHDMRDASEHTSATAHALSAPAPAMPIDDDTHEREGAAVVHNFPLFLFSEGEEKKA